MCKTHPFSILPMSWFNFAYSSVVICSRSKSRMNGPSISLNDLKKLGYQFNCFFSLLPQNFWVGGPILMILLYIIFFIWKLVLSVWSHFIEFWQCHPWKNRNKYVRDQLTNNSICTNRFRGFFFHLKAGVSPFQFGSITEVVFFVKVCDY